MALKQLNLRLNVPRYRRAAPPDVHRNQVMPLSIQLGLDFPVAAKGANLVFGPFTDFHADLLALKPGEDKGRTYGGRLLELFDTKSQYAGFPDQSYAMAMLVEQGADPTLKSKRGMNALHLAAANGEIMVMRLLVASGRCDYVARDNENRTAQHLARVGCGYLPIIRLLAQKESEQQLREGIVTARKLTEHGHLS